MTDTPGAEPDNETTPKASPLLWVTVNVTERLAAPPV